MPWIELDDNDPGQLDMAIRAAIHLCWMQMPPSRQTLQEVETVFRHRVDRALADLREDAEYFGPVLRQPGGTDETAAGLLTGPQTPPRIEHGEPI